MANSTTNLDLIATSQASKEVTANALFDALSPGVIFGRRAVTTASLTWGYYGGTYMKNDGSVITVANGTLALSPSTTNYVLQIDGVLSVTTTTPGGWPGTLTSGGRALYEVVTNATGVTSYSDLRTVASAAGGASFTSPLTTKGDLLARSATATDRLAVGSTGQVLTVNPAATYGFQWSTLATYSPPVTTKGDLFVFGTAAARLPVGTDGLVLLADSTVETGLRWGTPAASGGTPGGSNTQMQFNDGGAFAGIALMTWDKTNNVLYMGSTSVTGTVQGTSGATGASILIAGGTGTGTGGNGGGVTIRSGTTNTGGTSGGVTITTGAGGTDPGITIKPADLFGGPVTISAGSRSGGTGGALNLTGGLGSTSANGGASTLAGGEGFANGSLGGACTVRGGDGTGNGSPGGAVTVRGGNSLRSSIAGSVAPGNLTLSGGNAGGSTNTASGGSVTMSGGQGGAGGGNGGSVTVSGGAPQAGDGGAVSISGAAGVGTNRNGGNINLTPGAATGTGNPGNVILNNSGAALPTTAKGGFVCIATCAGTPTGVPANVATGTVPMVFDTAGLKLWIYTGGAWKSSAAFV